MEDPMRLSITLLLAACGTAPMPLADTAAPVADPVRVVLMSDPHVIASDYECCESPGLDTESITRTGERLTLVRDTVSSIDPAPEAVMVMGDIFHQNYKWETLAEYETKETAAGNAAAAFDTFPMPVQPVWGNHDYEVPEVSREFSHQLFEALFGLPPYYAVEHGGFKFLALNSQLGSTWDATSEDFSSGNGSFGAEQLAWIDRELSEGKPTFLMFHHPPFVLAREEFPGADIAGIDALVAKHADVLQAIFVGHTHRWIELAPWHGVRTVVVASTRYDPDSFWLMEIDPDAQTWRILDEDKAEWGTVNSAPWRYDGKEPMPAE